MAYIPDSAHLDLKNSLTEEATNILSNEIWNFLTIDLQSLALDSLLICRVFSSTQYYGGERDENGNRILVDLSDIFGDYSFALASAYKLFEGYVYLVAITTGTITSKQIQKEHFTIGSIVNIEHPKSKFKHIIEQIAEKIEDRTVLTRWQSLYDTYSDFRNSPAHYNNQIKEHYDEVKNDISHIITTIRNTTRYLFAANIIISKYNCIYSTVFEIPE